MALPKTRRGGDRRPHIRPRSDDRIPQTQTLSQPNR
ncbi:MAG: hypothetical protein QOF90_2983, partial [Acetobacteraceae bacterium]|nr:hypothetical protein [Acetobacteraceae bacterium]